MATNQFSFARADFNSVTTPKICENTSGRWVEYGEDNDYFNYVIDQYNNSVTNAAIINTITTWIEGGGLTAANKSTNIAGFESFLKKFKEDCFSRVVEDFKLQGMGAYQIIWAKNRLNIAAIYHMPIQYLRPEIMDENGKINHWYYSEDWQDYRKKKYKPEPIPVFTGKYKGHDREVFVIKQYKAGLTYFGSPDYVSSMRWIEVEGKVSVFHLNNISNSFQPSMIISFNNGIPTSQEEINVIEMALRRKFGGDTNAGKAIFLFNDSKEQGVEVTVVPSSDLDKQYEFVSNHARQMIITGHKVTSPMLLGIKEDTGLGNNADEIKNATLLFQTTVIAGFQKQILASIDFISKADGLNFMWEIIPYVPIQFTEGQKQIVEKTVEQKMSLDAPDMTDSDEQEWLDYLKGKGEILDEEEWELFDDSPAKSLDAEKSFNDMFNAFSVSPDGFDNASKKSKLDGKLYRVRYGFSKNISAKSRDFCIEMVELSKAGTVYRIEDIDNMSSAGVNGEFAEKGKSTYNIFEWVGGKYCHHFWRRLIFYKKGVDVSRQKAIAGVIKEGIERIAPINRPSRGAVN